MRNLFCIFILVVFSAVAVSQELNQPHISVYGDAKKEVVPDLMLWNLTVENRGAELKSVSLAHTRIVKEALKLIGQKGVEKKHIQTSGMKFGENYVYRDNSRVKEGYIATTSISFKMEEFDKYEALWLSLAKVDTVSVNSVTYDYSKRIEAQNETRVKALLAAKQKATALASAMGLALGEVIAISEDLTGNSFTSNKVQMNMFRSEMDQSASPIEPGTITIQMTIKLIVGIMSK